VSVEEVAERLGAIADELSEVSLDLLRRAAESVRDGGDPDPSLLAEERQLARARRSVEKAVALLGNVTGDAEELQ
jgi:hypothetical protein